VTEAGDRYRRRADAFEVLITNVAPGQWAQPSPCAGWNARDVVAHVVDYSAVVLRERVGLPEPPVMSEADEPLDSFRRTRALVERALDDPDTAADVARYLDLGLSFDLPQHGWDLAKATGQDATMDPAEIELLWDTLRRHPKVWDWQRDQGWYAAPLAVPDDAPLTTRVLAMLGRDHDWGAR